MKTTPKPKSARRLRVSDLALKKTAHRLLGQELVTPEVLYVKQALGDSATQQQIDEQVLGVRRMPWAELSASL